MNKHALLVVLAFTALLIVAASSVMKATTPTASRAAYQSSETRLYVATARIQIDLEYYQKCTADNPHQVIQRLRDPKLLQLILKTTGLGNSQNFTGPVSGENSLIKAIEDNLQIKSSQEETLGRGVFISLVDISFKHVQAEQAARFVNTFVNELYMLNSDGSKDLKEILGNCPQIKIHVIDQAIIPDTPVPSSPTL